MAGGGEGPTLEFTPTWVVAVVCTVIVGISLAAERALHSGGKYLKRKKQKPLYEALLKVKEELMLLGFISLLLTVFQNRITKICVTIIMIKQMRMLPIFPPPCLGALLGIPGGFLLLEVRLNRGTVAKSTRYLCYQLRHSTTCTSLSLS